MKHPQTPEEAWREFTQALINVFTPGIVWLTNHPKVIYAYCLGVVVMLLVFVLDKAGLW